MTSEAETDSTRTEILTWYAHNARELPWRLHGTTPWGVFVSEVMSQQTPVARIAPAWEQWLGRWPTPCALADASPADVIKEWGTLGYPRRALWLREAATTMCIEFSGQVPADYADLITLPGVGDYTAASVSAFAYQRRTIVLDTNVRRVFARVFTGVERPISSSATKIERCLADQLAPRDGVQAAEWAVASMEFGSLVCKATAPDCLICPIQDRCQWFRAGRPPNKCAPRKQQRFEGTDRQVRGKLMAVLRTSDQHGVLSAELIACWPVDDQRERCLASLITDGLVEPFAGDRYRLPH
ncbi:MAG: A/G-specific adenine glycosylase [Actinobacteria bacterium]|nr:A/G-specific adenine glycosylase [Actinomycetota bacterium]